jgi:hypothetical protein
MPLGAVVLLVVAGIVDGKPFAGFRIFGHPDLAAALTAFFGGIPALATGAAANFVRKKVRSLVAFAFVMAVIGALITAAYLSIVAVTLIGFRWGREISAIVGAVTATGGVAAFGCAILLCRSYFTSSRGGPDRKTARR